MMEGRNAGLQTAQGVSLGAIMGGSTSKPLQDKRLNMLVGQINDRISVIAKMQSATTDAIYRLAQQQTNSSNGDKCESQPVPDSHEGQLHSILSRLNEIARDEEFQMQALNSAV